MAVPTEYSAARTAVLAIITEITSEPKPSYNVDGQTVRWAEYLDRMEKSLDFWDKRIAAWGDRKEYRTTGVT